MDSSEFSKDEFVIQSNSYNSEFCNVVYQENDKVVLLTWKKFCCSEDYREPVRFALKLLTLYPKSNMVVDARNGFEDDEEDVEWGFHEFIPNMAKTDCKVLIFIMNYINEIEGEIDMWTKEFMKYFLVERVSSYDEAIVRMNHMISGN